jgi:hypothetical protein
VLPAVNQSVRAWCREKKAAVIEERTDEGQENDKTVYGVHDSLFAD